MQALVCHAPMDLRVESFPTDPLGPQQVRVHVAHGGICGSDLHYFQHGGFGTVRLQQPMVLGHEVSGIVAEVGQAVQHLRPGQRVAISPSRPCGQCVYCQRGHQNHCLDMRFYGSAMRFPHIQGAFRQDLVIEAYQAHPLRDDMDLSLAALAEPLRGFARHRTGGLGVWQNGARHRLRPDWQFAHWGAAPRRCGAHRGGRSER